MVASTLEGQVLYDTPAMTRWLATSALVLGVTGCFSPEPPTGIACSPPGSPSRCPSGLECVVLGGVERCEQPGTMEPDAAVEPDAVIDLDREGDGVLDDEDNCPDVANPDQLDEDGDGLGDVCDPCPPLPDNKDSDGDGLGDACDPNPMKAGDKLVAFEGFSRPLPGGWTSSGTVMTGNGDAVMIAGDSATSLLTRPSPAGARVEIRAGFVIDTITASGLNLGSVNVIERLQPNTDKAIACQLSGLSDGTQEELRIFDANASAVIKFASHAFSTGNELMLRMRRNGTTYGCRSGTSAELSGTATFSPSSPRIGLRVRGAAARFRWVMIVTSP